MMNRINKISQRTEPLACEPIKSENSSVFLALRPGDKLIFEGDLALDADGFVIEDGRLAQGCAATTCGYSEIQAVVCTTPEAILDVNDCAKIAPSCIRQKLSTLPTRIDSPPEDMFPRPFIVFEVVVKVR